LHEVDKPIDQEAMKRSRTTLIRSMAPVARNSGLFAAGVFDVEGSVPYSAILTCIQSVLQQLLTQHGETLASLVVAIRTAFEPNSGIGIVCDLVPELRHFFDASERPESKDVPLTHSVARFHALILKLIGVISTHFFMTWLIDDIHYADENSISLLASLVNVNKRLPIVLIMTHIDTIECLIKVKQILGGSNVTSHNHPGSHGLSGSVHHDPLVDEISSVSSPGSSNVPMTKTTAIRVAGLPLVVRGGGGVRFIKLQNPKLETIQEYLGAILNRTKDDVVPLATVFYNKPWLTIRQLVLELYRDKTIRFNRSIKMWEWESCPETLAMTVRKLTGEEYAFLESRFRSLDCETKMILICAAICGMLFSVLDLQRLASTAYVWSEHGNQHCEEGERGAASETPPDLNKGTSAMAGLQSALKEGILVYTSIPNHLRWHHNLMRKVVIGLLEETTNEKERIHYEMMKVLHKVSGQELKTASHILQCLSMVKRKLIRGPDRPSEKQPYWVPVLDKENPESHGPDAQALRNILSLAAEKLQKSGAQDKAMEYWNAAMSLLPENCWDPPSTVDVVADSDGEPSENESSDMLMGNETGPEEAPVKTALYQEALKLHLQCIEAERWREDFDRAMKLCDIVLAKITDPIDRARVYQHQIEMSVWAYSQPPKATQLAIQCLRELGVPESISFNPTQKEIKEIYDQTHIMLLEHMEILEADNPKECKDPRINMIMEVLCISK